MKRFYEKIKVYLIWIMLRIPFLWKYGMKLYAEELGRIFADSINRAELVKNTKSPEIALYELHPELKTLSYMMALLPAVVVYEQVSSIVDDRNWIYKIQPKSPVASSKEERRE